MHDHTRRVTRPFMEAWQDFQQGQETLLDLARLAEQAASALVATEACQASGG